MLNLFCTTAIVLACYVMLEIARVARDFRAGYRRGLADSKAFDFSAWTAAALEDEQEACQHWIAEGNPMAIARLNAIEAEQCIRRSKVDEVAESEVE